jgi:glycosyltransferase involved in cell wall biosynthesis
MPWLEPDFVLYTGGIEPRKNIDRLLRAYAGLPAEIQLRHQLLVVCRVEPVDRVRLEGELRELGIADRVHFPGFVPDEQLVRLYQAAGLVVFPSLYEGFGLPVAEALACGAAVIASETPALVELVDDPSARFDPHDTRAISSTMERFLENEQSLERLRAKGLDSRFSWPAVAERTAAAYEDALQLPERRRLRRPRVAWVSPLPPQRTGIADESYRVLRELSKRCEIDAYVDGPHADEVEPPEGVELKAVRNFEIAERAHGGYERVFYCLGNSEYHTGALALLGRRPGVVIAHDVRLNGLYSWRAHERPDLDPRPLTKILHSMYPGRLPRELGDHGWIATEDADRFGIFMAREAIASSDRFLVHSRHAAELARHEAPRGEERKIDVIPFGVVSPDELGPAAPDEPPVVATFGLVGPPKQVIKIVEAFPHVLVRGESKLAVVGPHTGADERRQLDARAQDLRITDHFQQTGYVEEPELKKWLARTTIAVQLRATSNGETSAAVAKCLAAGVPTIVTDIGSAAELPDAAALKVERDIAPEALGEVIADLLADSKRRAEMAAAGMDWARSRSHEHLARALYAEVVRG